MSTLHLLFGFRGRIGRTPFVLALLATIVASVVLIQAGELSLPAMATVLAPRGINAALVLNAVDGLIGAVAIWIALALIAKRLHDRGRSGWWGAAALLPLVGLALLNDALFLASRTIVLPGTVQLAVLIPAAALGIWVLVETAVLPGRDH
jgi:uncharacterized membrane protein YhaH (DUF805 family)